MRCERSPLTPLPHLPRDGQILSLAASSWLLTEAGTHTGHNGILFMRGVHPALTRQKGLSEWVSGSREDSGGGRTPCRPAGPG